MSGFANQIIPSLPSPISGNGLFAVNVVVPNVDSSFNTPQGTTQSDSYSYPLMDPANLIGTPSHPFMGVGLPAYITTLYNNVYNINTNLQNDISGAASDTRDYPTSFAVQQYVQSQISGTQIISGTNNTNIVVTTLNNTLIQTIPSTAETFSYSNGNTTSSMSLFWMDTSPNNSRVGASKTVIFCQLGYLISGGSITGNNVFLYAGDSSNFVYMGNEYKYYQFAFVGDSLSFIQAYSTTTSSWSWLITNFIMGVFWSNVNVDAAGVEINMSVTPGSSPLIPAGGTFGNLQ